MANQVTNLEENVTLTVLTRGQIVYKRRINYMDYKERGTFFLW